MALKRPRKFLRRAIVALDLDCFYASVAIRARPHLAEKPVVIVQKHLCVTSNYVARTRGEGAVQKMTPVSKALAACPDLVLIDGSDLTPFREASLDVRNVIRAWLRERVKRVSDRLSIPYFECPCQRLGLDEVFLDVSRLVESEISAGSMPWKFKGHIFGETHNDDVRRTLMVASQLAYDLRSHIIQKTQLTLCAGIGDSKQLAKLAVNMNKPNDQTTFLPDKSFEYVSGLHPRSLSGIGRGILAKIQQWALAHGNSRTIETVGDILFLLGSGHDGIKALTDILGSEAIARSVLALCKAEDASCVLDNGDAPKSISAEDSFRSCKTMSDLHGRITAQTTRLIRRLRQDGELYSRYPRTLTVSYRFRGQGYVGTTRSVQMPMEMISVCCSREPGAERKAVTAVRQSALAILKEHANIAGPSSSFDLTLFAVGASNFTDKGKSTDQKCIWNISDFFKNCTFQKNGTVESHTQQRDAPQDQGFRKGSSNSEHRRSILLEPSEQRSESQTVTERCPLCSITLPTENAEQNSHIDKCLGIQPKLARHAAKRRRTEAHTFSVDSFFKRA